MEWILWVLPAAIIAYMIVAGLLQRRHLKTLTEEEFRSGYRKAQLIDVREQKEYDNGHILGARNIPLSQLRMRYKEIRNDQPVYMYCESGMRTVRAAAVLRKKGIKDLYSLKGGFKKWNGKVKKGK
ncbi:rhodanese-like domain-containing protein [Pseudalkalibacillus salsuginis]|uniref:rhodanese-like domain-containing protein n=1 Tax=Pseudalkalibacillus salsuginis TaxID=2910972 RepID=UPI001F380D22|nr:rhodanese-like domain-containing protein [Pseudalkalibacillus salsuginis]MCF6408438.1 rhodanese-like domain-containing protein [Pseudalkalibacillus salsuginis]